MGLPIALNKKESFWRFEFLLLAVLMPLNIKALAEPHLKVLKTSSCYGHGRIFQNHKIAMENIHFIAYRSYCEVYSKYSCKWKHEAHAASISKFWKNEKRCDILLKLWVYRCLHSLQLQSDHYVCKTTGQVKPIQQCVNDSVVRTFDLIARSSRLTPCAGYWSSFKICKFSFWIEDLSDL